MNFFLSALGGNWERKTRWGIEIVSCLANVFAWSLGRYRRRTKMLFFTPRIRGLVKKIGFMMVSEGKFFFRALQNVEKVRRIFVTFNLFHDDKWFTYISRKYNNWNVYVKLHQRTGPTSGLLAFLRAEEAGHRTLTRARRTLTRALSRHSGASEIFLRCPLKIPPQDATRGAKSWMKRSFYGEAQNRGSSSGGSSIVGRRSCAIRWGCTRVGGAVVACEGRGG